MHFLCILYIAASMLAAPAGGPDTVRVEDATPLVRTEYRNLARRLAVSPSAVPTAGNDFDLIFEGKNYGEQLFADFRAAQELIELDIFLFGEDPDGERARDLLFEKVKQGVEVRYTHDSFGNFFNNLFDGRPVFTGFYDNLARGGIKVRDFSPMWRIDPTWANPTWRNHRKINIIDKKIAYTGGMNITEGSISGWNDAMLRITGPAVQSLRSVLLLNWNDLAPRRADRDELLLKVDGQVRESSGKVLQVVADGPDQPAFMAEETIVWLLDNAKEYFWFETPYFLPSAPVIKALRRAIKRGLDVKVITPVECDLPTLDPGYRSRIEECYKAGVEFYYRPLPFIHAKTFVCDDYILSVGSTNIDKLSLDSLYEINVLIYDGPSALEYKAYLQNAIDGSTKVDQAYIDAWDSKERTKQFFYRIVSPFL